MRRGWITILVLVSILAVFSARTAQAVPPPEEGPAQAAHGAGQEGGTDHAEKPDPFAWALDLTIWTSVVFVVLLLVLSRFAWKPMLAALQKREESIRSALEEADRARAEAQRMREQFQQDANQAQDQVRQLMEQSRRDAQQLKDQMQAEAKAEAQKERERLHREIETARDQALQQLWTQAAQLAAVVSSKAIGRQLTAEDHHRLVDEALAELPNTGASRRLG
jgi:F-type H+-transporting ATPase subunit b